MGSSPLTRGKHGYNQVRLGRTRLIPAHAGKTWHQAVPKQAQGAHPRSRGENLDVVSLYLIGVGSSPLTRGKHTRREITRDEHGLIPAHAGKTFSATTATCT